jgi:hypothetical protein
MALSEFTNAFDSVAADLERMYRGFKEGRGGAREAGVRDLVSILVTSRGCADNPVQIGRGRLHGPDAAIHETCS